MNLCKTYCLHFIGYERLICLYFDRQLWRKYGEVGEMWWRFARRFTCPQLRGSTLSSENCLENWRQPRPRIALHFGRRTAPAHSTSKFRALRIPSPEICVPMPRTALALEWDGG